ncbi:MAG: hypothetical protein ACLQDV_25055 [Candidatus Binataceae bacterium]|jgi:hypothetical protein
MADSNKDETSADKSDKPVKKIDVYNALVSTLTLLVLSATLVYVRNYANEAGTQTGFLNSSVTQQTNSVAEQVIVSRPVVLANGIQPVKKGKDQTGRSGFIPTNAPTDKAVIHAVNFGKTVAIDVVVLGVLAIGKGRATSSHRSSLRYKS